MRKNGSNVLLVEILLAVLFFMLSATVLVQVFAGARSLTLRSGVETRALAEAQNVADALYAAEDPEALLEGQEFISSHGAWSRDYGDFSLYVTLETEETDAGELRVGKVSGFYAKRDPSAARQEDEELFTLTCTRYEEVRA